MKSGNTFRAKYVPRKAGLKSHVCKSVDINKGYKKKSKVPLGKNHHSVTIPIEYEMALQEMYPDLSIALAIRKFIAENINLENHKE